MSEETERKLWIWSSCVELACLALVIGMWFAGVHNAILVVLGALLVIQLVRSWPHATGRE